MSTQVRSGYKLTDTGVYPEDWLACELGDLAPYVTSGSRGWAEYYSDRGDPFVRITNLSRSTIYIDQSDLKLVRLPVNDSEGLRTALADGDLLISITADIGIIGYVDSTLPKPSYINQHIALVRFSNYDIYSKYLSYFLAGERTQRLFRGSTDQGAKAGMNLAGIRAIKVVLPPIEEQRAIADALSDMDALISGLDQLIAKKRDIKQAVMQQLLTGKQRLPGFSGEWEVRRLGECLEFSPDYGINAPAVQFSDRLPTYIRITDITEDGRLSTDSLVSVDSIDAPNYYLANGDIVFARTGASVGKSYLYRLSDGPLVFAGFLIRVRVNQLLLFPDFLAAYVSTCPYWRWVQVMSMRSGQPGINGNEYAQLPIPVPTIEEQTAIATILSDMGSELVTLETRRDKAHQLKQGMMQELLTGKIRIS